MTDDALRKECEELLLNQIGCEYVHNTALDSLMTFAKSQRAAGIREAITIVESFNVANQVGYSLEDRAKELESCS